MNSLTREKGDTKEFRRLVLGEFFLAKVKENEKMNSTLLCSRFGKPENFRKLLAKEEEEEIQEDVQRDSKDVKDCNQLS